jgi:hypothetical protein
VAIISFIVIYFADRFSTSADGVKIPAVKWLNLLLIAFVMIVIVSAFKRLGLYVDAYGMSELRFYSMALITFLESLFLILAYTILRNKTETILNFVTLVLMIVFLAGINLINPHAYIAQTNLALLDKTDRLDTVYLNELSEDAVPTLVNYADTHDNDFSKAIWSNLYSKRLKLTDNDFRSWSFSKAIARELLNEKSAKLEQHKDYLMPVDQVSP